MLSRLLMRLFAVIAAIVSGVGFLWMTFAPPPGLKADRNGIPYFTPPVTHPITGEAIPVDTLVRHYKGGK